MDTRQQANITLWLVAIRRKLAETTEHRAFLLALQAEFTARLPEATR